MDKSTFPLKLGDYATISKTVTETDVYLFAGVSGDIAVIHLDEVYASGTPLGHRVAHGMLTFSIGSAAQTVMLNPRMKELDAANLACVSYGYDHVRFVKPVYMGDTITATYTIEEIDYEGGKTIASMIIKNQRDETVCVAKHIWKFFPKA